MIEPCTGNSSSIEDPFRHGDIYQEPVVLQRKDSYTYK